MSSPFRDPPIVRTLGDHARTRAAEHRALEAEVARAPLTDAADRIALAIAAQRSAGNPKRPRVATPSFRDARWALLVPLAAAAAVALAFRMPLHDADTDAVHAAAYTISVTGALQTDRATPALAAQTLDAAPGSHHEIVLRPTTRGHGDVGATVLVVRDGVGVPAVATPEISPSGALRVELPGELLAGSTEVRIVIAPARKLARAASAATTSPLATPDGDVAVVRIPVAPGDAKKVR